MTEEQELVLATVHELRDSLVDAAVLAVELNPDQDVTQFPRADLEQMVEGTLTAMREFYGGGERPFWDLYMTTVIPGILGVGFELPQVLHTVTSFYCLVSTELDRALASNAARDAARREFVRFSSAWMQAIARVPAGSRG